MSPAPQNFDHIDESNDMDVYGMAPTGDADPSSTPSPWGRRVRAGMLAATFFVASLATIKAGHEVYKALDDSIDADTEEPSDLLDVPEGGEGVDLTEKYDNEQIADYLEGRPDDPEVIVD